MKKNIITASIVLLTLLPTSPMDTTISGKEYLKYLEEYKSFKLGKSYGILRSDFDSLPKEVFNNFIRPFLTNIIATKFKHAILNHNYQEKTEHKNTDVLKVTTREFEKLKPFQYHDGTYTLAPDIEYNYAQWDEVPARKKLIITTSLETKFPTEYIQLLQGRNQEKSNFTLCTPLDQYEAKNNTDLCIITEQNIVNNYICQSKITHYVLSHDSEWLAIGLEKYNIDTVGVFNLNSRVLKNFPHGQSIGTLVAAHTSPLFLACSKDTETCQLINSLSNKYILFITKNLFNAPINAEFSPDDQQFIVYGGNTLVLYTNTTRNTQEKNLFNQQWDIERIHEETHIRKASFTPNGQLIIVTTADGNISFYSPVAGKTISLYPARWRCEGVADINQAPLLLYSTKNQLLISLDPASYITPAICTLVVRKLTNGRLLTGYNSYPQSPSAMGLTEDERSVVFIHNDNQVSLLHLYEDQDIKDMVFIQQKAHIYQLCQLLQICKQFKTDQKDDSSKNVNASPLVNAIRNYIRNAEAICLELNQT